VSRTGDAAISGPFETAGGLRVVSSESEGVTTCRQEIESRIKSWTIVLEIKAASVEVARWRVGENIRVQHRVAVLTTWLVAVALVTCLVIGWQSWETRRSANAARDNIAVFKSKERARIGFEILPVDLVGMNKLEITSSARMMSENGVVCKVTYSGLTPAFNVESTITARVLDIGQEIQVASVITYEPAIYDHPKSGHMNPPCRGGSASCFGVESSQGSELRPQALSRTAKWYQQQRLWESGNRKAISKAASAAVFCTT
jgi:hypothetical protein